MVLTLLSTRCKRLGSYLKNSSKWQKASLNETLEKFTPGAEGYLGGEKMDGVKTRYFNSVTGIEIVSDNENNYFRVMDYKKNQWIQVNGKLPNEGTLKGQDAKDFRQYMTHYLNTDKN